MPALRNAEPQSLAVLQEAVAQLMVPSLPQDQVPGGPT